MTDDRCNRAQILFQEALKLPSAEQSAYLAEACRDDVELRVEVESLLEHDKQAGNDFMKPPEGGADSRGAAARLTGARETGLDAINTKPVPAQPTTNTVPDVAPIIPDYEPIQCIGKGGFGEVWLARQRLTGVFYAVKVISRDRIGEVELDGAREYKQRAAGHPHLVALQHVGETDECYYYVMELADDARGSGVRSPEGYEALTLAERLKRTGALPAQEAVEITSQILDALSHLHEAGLLHRDIKPANVLGKDGMWKLGDMGLVTSHSRTENPAGTPVYAPPKGVIDRSGDLYCTGKLLMELITGAPPGASIDPQSIPVPGDSAMTRRITDVIARACDPDPKKRFQTAVGMRTVLRPAPQPRRFLLRISIIGIAAVLVLILGWWARNTNVSAPTAEPVMEVLFKLSKDAPGHHRLNERNVPLRTGSFVQVHVELGQPGYPYLFYLNESESPSLLPESRSLTVPVRTFDSPAMAADPQQQVWHTLSPPTGTEMFLLLVADSPVEDTDALGAALNAVRPPSLDRHSILIGDAARPELRWDTSRGLKPSSATAPQGMLNVLDDNWRSRFRHMRVLAFPHVSGESDAKLGEP